MSFVVVKLITKTTIQIFLKIWIETRYDIFGIGNPLAKSARIQKLCLNNLTSLRPKEC